MSGFIKRLFSGKGSDRTPVEETVSENEKQATQPDIAQHDSSVLDLAFAMDCTSSMSSYIASARGSIRKIVEEIVSSEKSDVHLALVEYRDHKPQDDTFVTRTHDFTGSVSKMKSWLDKCSAEGGGDTPEAVADALHDALKLSWRPNATKICVLISDAPPHGLGVTGDHFSKGCPSGLDPMEIVKQLAEKGVTLYVVGCEPAINQYKDFFVGMAYATGGQYVPLTAAKVLTQVIIGGAQEELTLEKWMTEVDEEVQRELKAGREVNEEELSVVIGQKLNAKGARAKQLQRNSTGIETASENSRFMSKCVNMADARKRWQASKPSDDSRGVRMIKRSKKGKSTRKRKSALAERGTTLDERLEVNTLDESSSEDDSSMDVRPSLARPGSKTSLDKWEAVERGITQCQAIRMVQKSKARNANLFTQKMSASGSS